MREDLKHLKAKRKKLQDALTKAKKKGQVRLHNSLWGRQLQFAQHVAHSGSQLLRPG